MKKAPSIWILVPRCWQIFQRAWMTPRPGQAKFRTGLLLLVTNQPFGWGMMALCGVLAARFSGHAKFWGILGAISYGISWGMLGLGVALAGVSAKKLLFAQIKLLWTGWKRLRRIRKKS